jgi:hypothetical protein
MQIIARRSGNPDLYEGLSADQDSLVVPQGVSEMEIRMRQVCVRNVSCIAVHICIVG